MARFSARFGVGHIVAAGILGGLVFAAFEMIAAAALNGPQAFFMPLRMIGGIALGAEALDPGYPLLMAGAAGVVVHMALSVAFAFLFAAMAWPTATAGSLAAIGAVFGLILWMVNFYAIAPVMGWTWFPERSNVVVQVVAHTVFFGSVIGYYLGRSSPQLAHEHGARELRERHI